MHRLSKLHKLCLKKDIYKYHLAAILLFLTYNSTTLKGYGEWKGVILRKYLYFFFKLDSKFTMIFVLNIYFNKSYDTFFELKSELF